MQLREGLTLNIRGLRELAKSRKALISRSIYISSMNYIILIIAGIAGATQGTYLARKRKAGKEEVRGR